MSPPTQMIGSSSASSFNHQSIFNNALQVYERRTKTNLLVHPLAYQLQSRDTPATIITLLREQLQIQAQDIVKNLTKWLNPIVNVLHTLSGSLGEVVILVISPVNVVFTGVGVLLSAAKETRESLDFLIGLFERIEGFFLRLEVGLEASLTREMVDIVIRIMVDTLSILAIATMEVKRGLRKNFMKKLFGRGDMEDGLKRLDTLTQKEARMASTQLVQAAHPADNRVMAMVDKEPGFKGDMVSVDRRGRGVRSREATIDDKFARVNIDRGEARVAVQQIASDEPQRELTERDDLSRWLSPPNPSTNYTIACKARHEGTARWFLEGGTFKRWTSTDSLLWVHGKPGSGKSVLCSAIIEDIKIMCDAGLALMAYFYFDFRDIDKQSRRDMIPSLLLQLSAQSIHYRDMLHRLYLAHFSGTQPPSDGVLTECLKDMLLIPNEVPVYIFMDAIDECSNVSGVPSPREEILGLVEELVNLRLPNLRLCVTSRPEIDICAALEPLSSFQLSLDDETGQKQDIANYILSSVHSDRRMGRWRKVDKDLVIQVLTERADGSFRWVYCQLNVLRHCFPPSLHRVLGELPEALDTTYERILMEINLPNRNQACRLFQCLAVAIRPFRVEEVAEVLAVDFDTEGGTPKLNVFSRWEDPEQVVLSACSSLVTIVDIAGSRVVKFSHYSVKEFLTSSRLATSSGRVSFYHISLEPAHTILAKACLSVLLLLDDHLDPNTIRHSPLAEYAAEHWVDHARFENVTYHIKEWMELLFDPEKPHFANWVSVYDVDEPLGSPTLLHPTRPNGTPLYYAALCGFDSLVKWLMDTRPMDIDARGGHHERAIQAALYKGHLSIVSLLIDNGADINSQDVEGSSLLHIATQTRNPEAVSLLLSRGAIVQPMLFTALNQGNFAVVQLLIDCGADVGVRDSDCSTALHIASGNEQLDAVRFLLDRSAEVYLQDNHGSTPLHLASAKGNYTISGLLMERGADPSAQDNTSSTPLHLASTHGNSNVVVLLIQHGADVNARDNKGSTPLHLASANGNDTTARLLIERGADVNVWDNTISTPLHLASAHGYSDVVVLLIERGADVNVCDNTMSTPLHLASAHGHSDVVVLPIRRGAYVDARDSKNSTPLHLASTKGSRTVVGSLDHGANMVAPGEKSNTPLHVASRHGPLDVIKLLLEHGAQLNAQNYEGRTPLHTASQEGAIDVVQCLLTEGANVNVRDHNDKIPRDVASNNSEVIELLTGHVRPNKR